jgi:hypothetical protein
MEVVLVRAFDTDWSLVAAAAGEAASHPLVLAVEERIEALMAHPSVVGGKKKLVKSEALQVGR